MSLRTFAIATSAVVCATLLSFGWSEQSGVSLSVESAQARFGRPWTPLSVAGVARRHYRRAAYGAAVVGAGLATGAYYGGYPSGYYGAYAAGGYPGGYYGGYANRSYVTGRPTLFSRYWGW